MAKLRFFIVSVIHILQILFFRDNLLILQNLNRFIFLIKIQLLNMKKLRYATYIAMAAVSLAANAKIDLKPELSLAGGTTGVELELGTSLSKWARVRGGFQYMPNFTVGMDFNMTAFSDGVVNDGNFNKISTLMKDLTGFEIDRNVRMNCNPTFYNVKFLADFYPFANKGKSLSSWHITAGFYAGSSRVGKAVNAMSEMPALVMVSMYNNLYDHATAPDFVETIIDKPLFGSIYLAPDAAEAIQQKLLESGRLGMRCGDYPDGTPYVMEPDKDGTVSANAYVNSFKPYVGIGVDQALAPKSHFTLGFDAGAMFWGGSPTVETHEKVVLNNLSRLPSQISSRMNDMTVFKAYPVLNLRLAYKF